MRQSCAHAPRTAKKHRNLRAVACGGSLPQATQTAAADDAETRYRSVASPATEGPIYYMHVSGATESVQESGASSSARSSEWQEGTAQGGIAVTCAELTACSKCTAALPATSKNTSCSPGTAVGALRRVACVPFVAPVASSTVLSAGTLVTLARKKSSVATPWCAMRVAGRGHRRCEAKYGAACSKIVNPRALPMCDAARQTCLDHSPAVSEKCVQHTLIEARHGGLAATSGSMAWS